MQLLPNCCRTMNEKRIYSWKLWGARICLSVFSCLIFSIQNKASEFNQKLSFESLDSLTKVLTEKKDWKGITQLGNLALKQDIDFSNLRLRLGIAYYELEAYRACIPHFEKVYETDKENALVNGYLYSAYLLSGDFEKANRFGHYGRVIDYIGLIGGVKNSNLTNYFGNLSFGGIDIHNRLGKSASLFESFGDLYQKNYYGTITQWNYYVNGTFGLGKGWKISPAFLVLNYKLTNTPTWVATENVMSEAGSLLITKRWVNMELGITGTYSNLNNHNQGQEGIILSWYPMGNMKFCLRGEFTLQQEDEMAKQFPMGNIRAMFQLGKRWNASLGYTYCEALYTLEGNGYLANNSPDRMNYKTNCILNYKISNHIGLMGLGQLEERYSSPSNKTYQFVTLMGGLNLFF